MTNAERATLEEAPSGSRESEQVARDAMRIDRFSQHMASAPAPRTDRSGWPSVLLSASHRTRGDPASIVGILLGLGMPTEEIDVIVEADQPMLHRYIELHGERLRERLAGQLQILARIEEIFTRAKTEAGLPISFASLEEAALADENRVGDG
jgi:hypothetical protein